MVLQRMTLVFNVTNLKYGKYDITSKKINNTKWLIKGLDGVNWKLTNGQKNNWQLTKSHKFNWQLAFAVRFTQWQLTKASAIVIPLKFMENNFLRLNCYYFNLFSVIFMPFKLCLNRNHHTEFYIKSVNINYLQFNSHRIQDSQLKTTQFRPQGEWIAWNCLLTLKQQSMCIESTSSCNKTT